MTAASGSETDPKAGTAHPGATDEALAELRRSSPVSTPQPGVYLAVRHGEVAAVLTDAEHFSGAAPRTLRGLKHEQDLTLQEIEGERHDRIRRVWLQAMRRDAIAAAEPRVREICRALVARLAPVGRAELVAELARPAAREGFHHLVGIPKGDRERVHRLSVEIKTAEATAPAELKPRVAAGAREALDAWIEDQIARRRALPDPPDDILTRLVRAADQPDARVSDPELIAQMRFLCRAATGSTVRLIANVLYELIHAPERYREIRQDRKLVPVALDESLRHDPPGQFTARTCIKQTELAGVAIEPGDEVVLSIASANRDESLFTGGGRFELARGRVPDQLAFGRGRHRCPGAPAARMVAASALEALLDKIPEVRLAPGFVYQAEEDFSARAPRHLRVEFPRGERTAHAPSRVAGRR
jgi:cytochrome P450